MSSCLGRIFRAGRVFVLILSLGFVTSPAWSQPEGSPPEPPSEVPTGQAGQDFFPRVDFRDTRDLLRLTAHEPIYFVTGHPNSKLQLSVKNQPIDRLEFYGAYTQLMLWDLGRKESSPVTSINFNPEFFYRLRFSQKAIFDWIDIGPYEHKSNGRDGPESRALNAGYLRFHTNYDSRSFHFEWTTKLYTFYTLDKANRDLRDYMGFWNSEISIAAFDFGLPFMQLYARVQPGRDGVRFDMGQQELGLRFKFERTRSLPYFYVQYFNGYGETLTTYNRTTSSVRAGIWL